MTAFWTPSSLFESKDPAEIWDSFSWGSNLEMTSMCSRVCTLRSHDLARASNSEDIGRALGCVSSPTKSRFQGGTCGMLFIQNQGIRGVGCR